MNSSDQFSGHTFAAVRLWEGIVLPAIDLVGAPHKSNVAHAPRATKRFSVPDHPM
ncbi:hypothetical protein [Gordonia sp. (in: high G+C Gram-positive bacteria)]|uniref:hypothetical protein n=1 Tax=Gordonia sp. (in: high G+C Gram-positive bacteria) TaxID=84139 RepID=UPI0039E34C63